MTKYDLWLAGIPQLGKKTLYTLWAATDGRPDFAELLYRMEGERGHDFVIGAFQKENRRRCREGREQYPAVMAERAAELLEKARKSCAREAYLGRAAEELERKRIRYVWAGDADYPKRLRQIEDPPFGIYVRGRLPEEERPSVGIVGARMASAYGRRTARYFAGRLAAAGVQIISGMARGIDGIAGRSALEEKGASFAVLGSGVDICYPEENRDLYEALAERGGLISEYRPGVQPENRFFPPRNRLISGLSDLILVVEARDRSGTLITVDRALEQGKDVWAVPGRIEDGCSRGCNRLIRQGAGIALSPELLLEALGMEGDSRAAREEAGAEQRDGRTMRNSERAEGEEPSAPLPVPDALIACMDRATAQCLGDVLDEVSRLAARRVSYAELQREATRLLLQGVLHEICAGRYIKQ